VVVDGSIGVSSVRSGVRQMLGVKLYKREGTLTAWMLTRRSARVSPKRKFLVIPETKLDISRLKSCGIKGLHTANIVVRMVDGPGA
jgi:hypothetical protein